MEHYDKLCRIIFSTVLGILGVVSILIVVAIVLVDVGTYAFLPSAVLSESTNSAILGVDAEKLMSIFGGQAEILMKAGLVVMLLVILSLMALQVFLLVGTMQRIAGCLWIWLILHTKAWLDIGIAACALHEFTFSYSSVGVPVGIIVLTFPIVVYIVLRRIQEIQADVRDNAHHDAF